MNMKEASFPSQSLPPEEAEEFMALLLEAQSSNHECVFCDYFKNGI